MYTTNKITSTQDRIDNTVTQRFYHATENGNMTTQKAKRKPYLRTTKYLKEIDAGDGS